MSRHGYDRVNEVSYQWIEGGSKTEDIPSELAEAMENCHHRINWALVDLDKMMGDKELAGIWGNDFMYGCMGEERELYDYCDCFYHQLIQEYKYNEIMNMFIGRSQEEYPLEILQISGKCLYLIDAQE